ncbi:helix-turn-helix domain-containing protein [Granulicella rosea]|uniref:helix-turn-helix domain-containing protein n=1 Tax=Granulicella rosea TaxID=474952 RepID=UPI003CCC444D
MCQFQERYIAHVLTKHRGHLGRTAEELQMHRNTLTRALLGLGLDVSQIRLDARRKPDVRIPL